MVPSPQANYITLADRNSPTEVTPGVKLVLSVSLYSSVKWG